jgi:ABC-type glycerol-3-phosphate transport system substrate-binding protein
LKRLATAYLLILALCAVIAGCGGGGSSSDEQAQVVREYTTSIAALGTRENKVRLEAQKVLRAKTLAEVKTRVTKFAQAEQQLGDAVAGLKTPKDAEAANDRLAKGAHDLAAELRSLLGELGSATRPKAAIALVVQRLATGKGTREIDAALSDLRGKGYVQGA